MEPDSRWLMKGRMVTPNVAHDIGMAWRLAVLGILLTAILIVLNRQQGWW